MRDGNNIIIIIIIIIPEQHTGTADNSHFGHCIHAARTTDVKLQKICYGRNNVTRSTNCNCRTVATLYG